MRKDGKKTLLTGSILLIAFVTWTILVQTVDVQNTGLNGTDIGLATFNNWFHRLTGVHMLLYFITDWLGLVPIFVCLVFAGIGFAQLVRRKNLLKVDYDLLFLGIYYLLVIFSYLIFEMIPINYRPLFIEGMMEASYPSSTTLLVLCVMPTLVEQTERRLKKSIYKKSINILAISFSIFMVLARLISGVHWFTDIVGAILLSAGLFYIYKAVVLLGKKKSTS